MAKKGSRPGRAAPAALCSLLVAGLAFGAVAEARERSGAPVRVYLKAGSQVRGELLAVGSDSLTVLETSGTETSCGAAEIGRVILDKKSKRTQWVFIGFAAGAAGGYLVGANPRNWAHDDDTLVLRGIGSGLLWGVTGALVGLIVTEAAGPSRQTVFAFEGLSDEQVRATLALLKRSARIRD